MNYLIYKEKFLGSIDEECQDSHEKYNNKDIRICKPTSLGFE